MCCLFLLFNLARLSAYFFTGVLDFEAVTMGLVLLPVMVTSSVIGMKAHHKVNEELFRKGVSVLLLLIGLRLIL